MDEKRAIAALGALAQETRLALFRLLVTCGPAGLPAGVIAERLGVQPSSLSFHLPQLVHAGLITQRRVSRQLIYSAEYGAMNELIGLPDRKLLRPRRGMRPGLQSRRHLYQRRELMKRFHVHVVLRTWRNLSGSIPRCSRPSRPY